MSCSIDAITRDCSSQQPPDASTQFAKRSTLVVSVRLHYSSSSNMRTTSSRLNAKFNLFDTSSNARQRNAWTTVRWENTVRLQHHLSRSLASFFIKHQSKAHFSTRSSQLNKKIPPTHIQSYFCAFALPIM